MRARMVERLVSASRGQPTRSTRLQRSPLSWDRVSNASSTSALFCSEVACIAYPAGSNSPTQHFHHLCIQAIDESVLTGSRVLAELLRTFDQNLIHIRSPASDRFF